AGGRDLRFRVTVRDNHPGGGGVVSTPGAAPTVLEVVDTGAAFAVDTANAGGTSWAANSTQLVAWIVADTDQPPIGCASVDIDFSPDGGRSFPFRLATAVPNDGDENIVVPAQNTAIGRLRVGCSDSIFFDINDADIAVTGGGNPPAVVNFGAAI